MSTKLDIIRRVAENHVFNPDINWAKLPKDVGDAAAVRGDPIVELKFIEQVIAEAKEGRIHVKESFPNGTPSLSVLYEIARERQETAQAGESMRSLRIGLRNTSRRSRARKLKGIKPRLDS